MTAIPPSEEDRIRVALTCQMLKTVCDDRLFFLLCRIDDDNSDCKLDCFAGGLLEKTKDGSLKVLSLMKDVLQYAHSKHFGFKDAMEHHERRQRIPNVQMLKKARLVLNKRTYESMDWKDFAPTQEGDRQTAS